MEIKLMETKSKVTEKATYTCETFDTEDYRIERYTTAYAEGFTHVSFDIRSKLEGTYLPHIFYFDDFFGSSKPRFEIQTTSYGTMGIEDFDRFLTAQIIAKETLVALTAAFIND